MTYICIYNTGSCSTLSKQVRATHGCHEGTWYYEVTINKLGVSGAVRVGWATRVCDLQTPVGADAGGFAIRSVDGSKVHEGVREDYGEPFDEGDVVGCLISMPPGGRSLEKTVDGMYDLLDCGKLPSEDDVQQRIFAVVSFWFAFRFLNVCTSCL